MTPTRAARSVRPACRFCGATLPRATGSLVTRLIHSGLSEPEAMARMPVCQDCVESKYVAPSRAKYHDDPNVNAVLLWCASRRQDAEEVRIADEGPTWMVNIGGACQRFPKRESIPVGVVFARLDSLTGRSPRPDRP